MIAWLKASKLAVGVGTIQTANKIPQLSSKLDFLDTFRLDLQGPDKQYLPKLKFNRYAIQYNRKGKQNKNSAVQFARYTSRARSSSTITRTQLRFSWASLSRWTNKKIYG